MSRPLEPMAQNWAALTVSSSPIWADISSSGHTSPSVISVAATSNTGRDVSLGFAPLAQSSGLIAQDDRAG